jgi:hypothetical protein
VSEESKVCPECGSPRFTTRQSRYVELTVRFQHGQWVETREEVIDSDRLGENTINCDDCGRETEDDDLVTEDEFNACEHTDSEDFYCLDCGEFVGPEGDDYEVDC